MNINTKLLALVSVVADRFYAFASLPNHVAQLDGRLVNIEEKLEIDITTLTNENRDLKNENNELKNLACPLSPEGRSIEDWLNSIDYKDLD